MEADTTARVRSDATSRNMAVMEAPFDRAFGDQHVADLSRTVTIIKKNNHITHLPQKFSSLEDACLKAHMDYFH